MYALSLNVCGTVFYGQSLLYRFYACYIILLWKRPSLNWMLVDFVEVSFISSRFVVWIRSAPWLPAQPEFVLRGEPKLPCRLYR